MIKRLGVLTVAAAAALVGVAGPANAAQIKGWTVVDQTTVSDAVAGEGVATVRVPGQPLRIDYTDGATIPANILAEGWGHIGDPDSLHGYVFDPYQQVVAAPTEKMFLVTTPTGQ